MPSSLQIIPSHNESTAPSTQPSIACGPPIAATISGNVTNGPTPTMSMMFSPSAATVESPRSNSGSVSPAGRAGLLAFTGLPNE